MRIFLNIKDYNEIYEIVKECGGDNEMFVTNDCLELGDDPEDKNLNNNILSKLREAKIEYKTE